MKGGKTCGSMLIDSDDLVGTRSLMKLTKEATQKSEATGYRAE